MYFFNLNVVNVRIKVVLDMSYMILELFGYCIGVYILGVLIKDVKK